VALASRRLLRSIGGVTGSDNRTEAPTPLRCDTKPFERGTVPARDVRFDTFKHTGDYDTADGEDRFPKDSYESLRLRFIRTQRDEIDAIEAFGTFIWDIRFKDFDAEYDLARITWDEARHTEIGHRAMLIAGYDPFELRNRLTGSTCRGPMDPAFAMARSISFGEVGVLEDDQLSLIDTAANRNDEVLRHIADFIRSDERNARPQRRSHHRRDDRSSKPRPSNSARASFSPNAREPRRGCDEGHGCVHGLARGHRAARGRVRSFAKARCKVEPGAESSGDPGASTPKRQTPNAKPKDFRQDVV
jgi:hypothetical protein